MKPIIFVWVPALLGLFCAANVSAQTQEFPGERADIAAALRPARPSVLDLVSEVRDSIGLDQKEFDKLFAAYQKFNSSVFGDESGSGAPGGGMPGMRGGGPGGQGGPGGGMPPGGGGFGGGMGGRGGGGFGGGQGGPGGQGGFGGGTPPAMNGDGNPGGGAPFDPAKLEQTRIKAEAKLCKAAKKTFKKDTEKYDRWLAVWNVQLSRILPQMPQGDAPAELPGPPPGSDSDNNPS